MKYRTLTNWIEKNLNLKIRLTQVAIAYLIFLMISIRKHSLKEAANFSNSSESRFSRFLKDHPDLAVTKLSELSKRQAKQFGKGFLKALADGSVPWEIAIIIDSTLQKRSSLHAENVKRFNHGKGFVIGHQWTNIILIINDILIPLPPIAFYSKSYCRKNNMTYKTEHKNVFEYLKKLDLAEYIGPHNPKKVVVLADSGYDNNKIESLIDRKGWRYIIALKKKRTVKTEKEYASTAKSKDWSQVEKVFKANRWIKWITVFLPKNSTTKKRTEFRIRAITGYLRDVGKAQLICSEFKKGPKGRRKYLASNDLKATPRQILMGYRMRWGIETFHKKAFFISRLTLFKSYFGKGYFTFVITLRFFNYFQYELL